VDGDEDGNRLGSYLQARRALITPEQAGIPAGLHRRVAGLRREEVALLAGISPDYYLRLERGRDRNPSEQVLTALARVLQLDDVEHRYLVELAEPRRRARPRRRPETVPARLGSLLTAVGVPALVEGRAFDVLAANPLAAALNPRLRPGENRLRSLLLDPDERGFHTDWEAATAEFVGSFRRSIDDAADDPRVVELVGELSLASARFRTLWARHDVHRLAGGTTTVHHPVVGDLRLHRDKLPVDGLTLVLYYADTGSDSAEKLQLLASLTAPAPPGAVPAEPRPAGRPGEQDVGSAGPTG
jgi:transcriptional regulator with XRE-family HTH domain